MTFIINRESLILVHVP